MGADWSDLQTILQIARSGTLSGAGRALGVSQSTISRRLQAIEARLDRAVFLRRADGRLEASREGQVLIAAAERMAAALAEAEDALRAATHPIRVATCEAIARAVILPGLAAWRRESGRLAELLVFDDLRDLAPESFDVLVTTEDARPREMVGRRLVRLEYALYVAAATAEPGPGLLASLDGLPVIGAAGPFADVDISRWFAAQGGDIVLTSSSPQTQQEAAASGLGIALLPVALASDDSRLRRIDFAGVPSSGIWMLASRPSLKQPRVRTFTRWCYRHFSGRSDRRLFSAAAT